MTADQQRIYQEKFKEINEAYQILSNEDTRAKYDKYLGISFEESYHSLREDSIYAKILREKEEK